MSYQQDSYTCDKEPSVYIQKHRSFVIEYKTQQTSPYPPKIDLLLFSSLLDTKNQFFSYRKKVSLMEGLMETWQLSKTLVI